MIATGREGEEGEKVDFKICLAWELNQDLQHERREHWRKFKFIEIRYYKYHVAVFFQFPPLKDP